jgi:hypothetical protein
MLHAYVYKLCFISEVQIEYRGQKCGAIEGNQAIIQEAPSALYAKHYVVVHFTTTTTTTTTTVCFVFNFVRTVAQLYSLCGCCPVRYDIHSLVNGFSVLEKCDSGGVLP